MKDIVAGRIYSIDINKIKPQNKKNFALFPVENGKKIKSMINSIRDCGQDRPIEITKDYRIVCGHNRYFGAKQAGKKRVDCIFKEFDSEKDEIAFMIRENFVRRQFTRETRNKVIENFVKLYGGDVSAKEISRTFGFPISTAARALSDLQMKGFTVGKKKSKKKHSPEERQLDLINKRHANTLYELQHCPIAVIRKARKKAENYLTGIKSLEKKRHR
ncbi:MAG TPA: ParB/RepB/Spo0J family partition protein [Methanofastidiosum sp.]|nr:ParB/RepB/Spo0J family partition protein [Methanofastidiosum sp.]